MVEGDELIQKYLFLGYEYSVAKALMDKGAKTKTEAIKELKMYILMNIRDFNINQDRGRLNRINKAIPNILWYFKNG